MQYAGALAVCAGLLIPLCLIKFPDGGPKEASVAYHVPPHPRGYVCYRATGPILIDGRLDEPSWQAVPYSDPFVDIEGDSRPQPRLRTRVKMLWDDDYFYVAAELEEPHVWATLTKHDSYIFHDDNDFEVFIDPDGDSHNYCEFEINARNTGWDLLLTRPYKDGGQAIDGWEMPGFKSAVHVDGTLNDPRDLDRGWTIEMAFPWKVLTELTASKQRPKDGEQWRLNFSRVEWRHEIVNGKYRRVADTREDNWVWSPQGVVNMHRPETWGYVQFSTAAPGTVSFKPDPAWPARCILHAIYYGQHEFRKLHGRWARDLDELGLAKDGHPSIRGKPVMETTTNLFEARVTVPLRDTQSQTCHIRQDALVWHD